jgi:Transposase DDE domain group 1
MEMLVEEENFAGLTRLNRALIGRAEAKDSTYRAVLDMDSTEIPAYGEQEQSAYNGHFESTCYHPLLLFNREGDCLAGKLRPGNVHSAEGGPRDMRLTGRGRRVSPDISPAMKESAD